jgi:hypothetical protein
MKPTSIFFLPRFKIALNGRLKKQFKGAPDYRKTEVQTKIQAIALTVLQDFGIKDYNVLVGVKAKAGGKGEIGFTFIKTK